VPAPTIVAFLLPRSRQPPWGAAKDPTRPRREGSRIRRGGTVTAIHIDEGFVVKAPVARVWAYLVDPRRVVACVPGGELGDVLDDRTFHGEVRVVFGPLTLAYRGRVQLAEVDAEGWRVKIVGRARERAGTDSARLTLESRLIPLLGGGTEVVAHAWVDVDGRIVELGRGVLEAVAHLVFQDFASCVRATVEAEEAGRAEGAPAARAAPARREALRGFPLVLRALSAWVAAFLRSRGGAART
jgi:carbon monoxide dehydrogenase subunit G